MGYDTEKVAVALKVWILNMSTTCSLICSYAFEFVAQIVKYFQMRICDIHCRKWTHFDCIVLKISEKNMNCVPLAKFPLASLSFKLFNVICNLIAMNI